MFEAPQPNPSFTVSPTQPNLTRAVPDQARTPDSWVWGVGAPEASRLAWRGGCNAGGGKVQPKSLQKRFVNMMLRSGNEIEAPRAASNGDPLTHLKRWRHRR